MAKPRTHPYTEFGKALHDLISEFDPRISLRDFCVNHAHVNYYNINKCCGPRLNPPNPGTVIALLKVTSTKFPPDKVIKYYLRMRNGEPPSVYDVLDMYNEYDENTIREIIREQTQDTTTIYTSYFGANRSFPNLWTSFDDQAKYVSKMVQDSTKHIAKIIVATGSSIFDLIEGYLRQCYDEGCSVPELDAFIALVDYHANDLFITANNKDWANESCDYFTKRFHELNQLSITLSGGRFRIHCALYNFLPCIQGICYDDKRLYLGWFEWKPGTSSKRVLSGADKRLYRYDKKASISNDDWHFELFNNWFDQAWTGGNQKYLKAFQAFTQVTGNVEKIKIAPLVIAHRGYSSNYPENSLEAISAAIESSDYIEIDIRETDAHEFILSHDRVNQADETNVPRLADALNICRNNVGLIIEIKDIKSYDLFADLIRNSRFFFPQIVVISFNEEILEKIHQYMPDIPIGLIIADQKPENIIQTVEQTSMKFVGIDNHLVDRELVEELRRNGTAVFTWNLKSEDDVFSAIEAGVVGIVTDNPNFTKHIIERNWTAPLGLDRYG